MSQSIDFSTVTECTFDGSDVEQINLDGVGIWTKVTGCDTYLCTPFDLTGVREGIYDSMPTWTPTTGYHSAVYDTSGFNDFGGNIGIHLAAVTGVGAPIVVAYGGEVFIGVYENMAKQLIGLYGADAHYIESARIFPDDFSVMPGISLRTYLRFRGAGSSSEYQGIATTVSLYADSASNGGGYNFRPMAKVTATGMVPIGLAARAYNQVYNVTNQYGDVNTINEASSYYIEVEGTLSKFFLSMRGLTHTIHFDSSTGDLWGHDQHSSNTQAEQDINKNVVVSL